jgi:hypothetical protein
MGKKPHSSHDRGDRKAPRSHFAGTGRKAARGEAPGVLRQRPLWAFRFADVGGPWCWCTLGGSEHAEVLDRLKRFESMTWGEIEGGEHHFVSVSGCCRKAQIRLAELRHDDAGQLFPPRITGRKRIHGFRHEHVPSFLWWDREHEVYPSVKKHP